MSSGQDFAQAQLEKYGWSKGKGLGRDETGITEPLRPKLKFDAAGMGYDRAEEYTFQWWDHVYNKAASAMTVQKDKNGSVQVTRTKELQVSKKRPSSADNKNKYSYGGFVKGGTLKGKEEEKEAGTDEEEERDRSLRLTDAQLFQICGGRTAHKGARHGFNMSAKLARIEEQERRLMEAWTNPKKDQVEEKKKRKNEGDGDSDDNVPREEVVEEDENSTMEALKQKKSKKRKQQQQEYKSTEEKEDEDNARKSSHVEVTDTEDAIRVQKKKKKKKRNRKTEDNKEFYTQDGQDMKDTKESVSSKSPDSDSAKEEEENKKKKKKKKTKKSKCKSDSKDSEGVNIGEPAIVGKKKKKKKRKECRDEKENHVVDVEINIAVKRDKKVRPEDKENDSKLVEGESTNNRKNNKNKKRKKEEVDAPTLSNEIVQEHQVKKKKKKSKTIKED